MAAQKVEKKSSSGDTLFAEEWVRDDGKKYVTVGRVHPRAAGSTKPPRVSRVAIPAEDWKLFQSVVAAFKG